MGDILQLRRETDNCKDNFTVSGCKITRIKGHIPRRLSHILSTFLQRDISEGVAEATGERVNRGARYGIEVPCKSRVSFISLERRC